MRELILLCCHKRGMTHPTINLSVANPQTRRPHRGAIRDNGPSAGAAVGAWVCHTRHEKSEE
jgi:hypothetical protein